MTKKEQKKTAARLITEAIGGAWYKTEGMDLSQEDVEAISYYIYKLGTRACKAIGTEYVGY